ncbi:UrvD/REP family ATP-dependent DNA helicase [Occultella kanbiaonis]|uniref:UrvD/REP family ATP-dependent DNA helicase n=1 Tax=Occultella kanbiaonis TaxID=2675754 RepID=UPI0013D62833|nr:UrvD/REP family ATP-dependent DNA helicase [Occultella kanbiaonis]
MSSAAAPDPSGRPDPSQEAARRAIGVGGHHVVHGAPGSGKTQTALAAFVDALESVDARSANLFLVPTRQRAAVLRDEVARRLRRTTGTALVRTPASLAFAILRLRASHRGEAAPTLITGPEQDQVLAELLAGHLEGEGASIDWPAAVGPETRSLRAFRDELRDLLMRAAEAGLDGPGLAAWGERHGRPEWRAAGRLLTEYTEVTSLGELTPDRGARFDAATIVDEAVGALRSWEREVPGVPRPRWDLVVHDDYQDATMATARLLEAMAEDGTRLALFGDPDIGVQGFRGGLPALLHSATLPPARGGPEAGPTAPGLWGAGEHVLETVWRHADPVRTAVATLTASLPTMQETRRRRALAAGDGSDTVGEVRTAVLASQAQEVAFIARELREQHLHDGVPWSRMAVIVRSGSDIGTIRRGLRTAGVPLAMAAPDRPLRDEPAVRPLLIALDCVLADDVDPVAGTELLLSPLGGLDPVSLRSLRRALRQAERTDGGDRHSDDLLAAALTDRATLAALPVRHRRGPQRVAEVLAAGRAALDAPESSVETILWALWDAAGLAATWQQRALTGGAAADRADADLDAVMALFRAAEQFVDRTARSTPSGFVHHLGAQDFPADTLAARGSLGDSVAVHTPASAAGAEWDVVVVAGVQEDTWPDLRIRDTLLGAADLADIATARHVHLSSGAGAATGGGAGAVGADADAGGADGAGSTGGAGARRGSANLIAIRAERNRRARREVYEGELRTFVMACSRTRRSLLVTAVLDTDARPSEFFEALAPDAVEAQNVRSVPSPLDLRGLVGELRAAVRPVLSGAEIRPDQVALASEAAAVLTHLAGHRVDGADPGTWPALTAPTSSAPLWQELTPVTVTPSTVETVAACPLRWALTTSGGRRGDSASQSLGNLVHEIAAAAPHGTEPELLADLDTRWHELDLGDGWMGRRDRSRAEEMIRKLAGYQAAHPGRVETEVEFGADLGRVALRGRVDRVEYTGAGVRIVDLKTGSTAISAADAGRNPQLGSYQVAAEQGAFDGEGAAGAALLYVGTSAKSGAVTRDQTPLHDDPEPGWATEMLTAAAETMAGAGFTAQPGPLCRTCVVRTSCPAQPEGSRVTGALGGATLEEGAR